MLIVRPARENTRRGVARIRGELRRPGRRVAASAVGEILRARGIAPPSGHGRSWRVLARPRRRAPGRWLLPRRLRAHAHPPVGRVRHRTPGAAGAPARDHQVPGGPPRFARNLASEPEEAGGRFTRLIRGRGPDFTAASGAVSAPARIITRPAAPRAATMNARAERFARTARAGHAGRMLIAAGQHRRAIPAGCTGHDHTGRSHQGDGTGPRPPDDDPDPIALPVPATWIQHRTRLAGPTSQYQQAARKPRPAPAAESSTSTGSGMYGLPGPPTDVVTAHSLADATLPCRSIT